MKDQCESRERKKKKLIKAVTLDFVISVKVTRKTGKLLREILTGFRDDALLAE